ncbi:MAG: DedA family protein [Paludibacteraceae bacterium]|nr:DedA family protein [Paludibacteraceae bacterium]
MLEGLYVYGYLGLFVASFLASTIVPLASEAVFAAVVWKAGADPLICVFVATAGNTLGALTCYWIGSLGKIEWIKKWFRVDEEKLYRMVDKLKKRGVWLAFLSFLPVVGDVIAIATGYVRCNLLATTALFFAGKFFRYVIWMFFQNQFIF